MLKKILAIVAMLYAAASFAAVEANAAKSADLDGVKGIGPVMSKNILDARKKGEFKDWADFIGRVKGVGEAKAEALSKEGLTINGQPFKAAAAKAEDKKPAAKAKAEEKKAEVKAKAEEKKAEVKPKAEEKKAEVKAKVEEKKADAKTAAASGAKPATPATPATPAAPAASAKK